MQHIILELRILPSAYDVLLAFTGAGFKRLTARISNDASL